MTYEQRDPPNQYGTNRNCYQIGVDKPIQNRDKQSRTIPDTDIKPRGYDEPGSVNLTQQDVSID